MHQIPIKIASFLHHFVILCRKRAKKQRAGDLAGSTISSGPSCFSLPLPGLCRRNLCALRARQKKGQFLTILFPQFTAIAAITPPFGRQTAPLRAAVNCGNKTVRNCALFLRCPWRDIRHAARDGGEGRRGADGYPNAGESPVMYLLS